MLCFRCAGMRDSDFEFGPCSAKNPCDPDPCGERLKCVAIRKVCLSLLERPCRQHVCGSYLIALSFFFSNEKILETFYYINILFLTYSGFNNDLFRTAERISM